MPSKKGNQGPKSPAGKKRSAKNSTKHGLSSSALTTVEQRRDYEFFYQQLVDEHQLKSQLELFQAKRVSISKVKVEAAYIQESLALGIERERIRNNPQSVIAELKFLDPVVIGMLKELFQFQKLLLPCRLTPVLLNQICQEMNQFTGELLSEDAFKEQLPCLSAYLTTYQFSRELRLLYERLEVVSQEIQNVLNRGELYAEYVSQFLHELNDPKHERLEPDEEMDELTLYCIEQQHKRNQNKIFEVDYPEPKPYPSHDELRAWMKPFLLLQKHYGTAHAYEEKVLKSIEFKVNAAQVSNEEIERFMRYQQFWDKRYSTNMAELMALLRERQQRPD